MLTFGRASIVFVASMAGWGCPGKLPCTDTGEGSLVIPDSRVDAVLDIQSDGGCEVFAPVADCDAGGCVDWRDAGPSHSYRVVSQNPGECTVTVTFSDGCEPEVFEFVFGGPIDNCCSEACARGGSETVNPTCEIDAGP